MTKPADEIIEDLRAARNSAALPLRPAEVRELIETPEPPILTAEFPDKLDSPKIQRAIQDNLACQDEMEPPVGLIGKTMSEDELREVTKFAVIARGLQKGFSNEKILEDLTESGYDMALRTLQRIYKTDAFRAYYDNYRGRVYDQIDAMVREDMMLAAPEAFLHHIRLMRHAKSANTQLEAAQYILEKGVFAKDGENDTLKISIPADIVRELIKKGQTLADVPMNPLKMLSPAKESRHD